MELVQPWWKSVWSFLKTLKINIYGWDMPFLGTHRETNAAHNCTSMPTTALMITALVSIYRWMGRVTTVWMLNGVLFSPKEERNHIAWSKTDVPEDHVLTEIIQVQEDKMHTFSSYMWNWGWGHESRERLLGKRKWISGKREGVEPRYYRVDYKPCTLCGYIKCLS